MITFIVAVLLYLWISKWYYYHQTMQLLKGVTKILKQYGHTILHMDMYKYTYINKYNYSISTKL